MNVRTREAFREVVSGWADTLIAVDYETNGYKVWHPASRLAGVGLAGYDTRSGEATGLYIPLAHQHWENADPALLGDVAEFLATRPLAAFSLEMEVSWTVAKLRQRYRWVSDPYIMGRMLGLETHRLKDMVAAQLGHEPLYIEDLLPLGSFDFTAANPDDPRVMAYTSGPFGDAVATLKLDTLLRDQITKQGMMAVYLLEVAASVLMTEQAMTGYPVDAALWQAGQEEAGAVLVKTDADAHAILGPINLDSVTQVGRVMNARGIHSPVLTEQRRRESWSADATVLLPASPEVDALRAYRKSASVVRALRAITLPEDGVLRPRWRSIGVNGSAQMFSETPGLTILPVQARKAFRAPEGRTWVGIGYKTLTPHLLAHLSGDAHLIRLVTNDDAYLGFQMLAETPSVDRSAGKTAFYEYLVTAGDGPPGYEEATALFAQATAYLRGVRSQALETGWFTSLMGRRRQVQESVDPTLAGRSTLARFFQQSAATQIKAALVRAASLCSPGEMQHLIVMTDKVFYTVPTAYGQEHLDAVRPCFEDAYFPQRVRLPVEVKVGDSWGDLEGL